MRSLAAAAVTVAVVIASGSSAVAGEGESALSFGAIFGVMNVGQGTSNRPVDKDGVGGLIGVDFQHGFGDSFWLRLGAAGGPVVVNSQVGYTTVATAGITYAIDVLKYVPYVGIGAGAVLVGGGALSTHVDPVLDLAVGIEVQQSPGFAWGVEARLESFASNTTLFTIGPRLSWKWGYF